MIWNWKLPTINFPGEKCIGLRGSTLSCIILVAKRYSIGILMLVLLQKVVWPMATPSYYNHNTYYYLAFFTCWLAFMVKSQTYRLERKFADRPFSDGLLCYNEYLSTVYILRLQYALHFSMINTKTQSTAK